jgi:hypothetical protein
MIPAPLNSRNTAENQISAVFLEFSGVGVSWPDPHTINLVWECSGELAQFLHCQTQKTPLKNDFR